MGKLKLRFSCSGDEGRLPGQVGVGLRRVAPFLHKTLLVRRHGFTLIRVVL